MTHFSRVPRTARGYHVEDVDSFFAQAKGAYDRGASTSATSSGKSVSSVDVRTVAFRLRRGGYDIHAVDSSLDRLEDAFAARERERLVEEAGDQGLLDELTRRAATLQGRLDRPAGERFSHPRRLRERGYDRDEVDALCDRLHAYFNEGFEMSADEVRRAVFSPRRGRRAYREPEVDAFLDRVVEIMVTVD